MGTGNECRVGYGGAPATSLMSEWLKDGTVKEMIPPPTQPLD